MSKTKCQVHFTSIISNSCINLYRFPFYRLRKHDPEKASNKLKARSLLIIVTGCPGLGLGLRLGLRGVLLAWTQVLGCPYYTLHP